jgi:hypothetical protein
MKAWEESRGLFDRYKHMTSEISRAAEAFRVSESFASKYLSDMAREKEQLILATRTIADQFLSNQALINQQLSSYNSAARLIREDCERLRMLVRPAQEAMDQIRSSVLGVREAALYWETEISQTMAHLKEMNILERNEPLAIRLLQPSMAYASFIESTFKKVNNIGEDTIGEKALMASLCVTESQFSGINDLLSTVISPEIEIISPSPVRSLRLPRIQQIELLRSPEMEEVEDEEDIVRLSPAAGAAALTRAVLRMVTGCNEENLASGKQEVFKTTTRFVEAVADMIWLLPHDKRTFADFVDCLYFIFYEGAGRDKLRYLKGHGGVLESEDCNFVWSIKILRNKWLRHDLEHGNPSNIRRSRETLLEQFNLLGLKQFPRSAADYRFLHRKLLEEARSFMQRVWNKISEGSE